MSAIAIRIYTCDILIYADPVLGLSPTRSTFQPRDHLESLITKHGYPTPVSLSSLRDLTATSSTYTPPSPRYSDAIPTDAFDSLTLSSSTRPIPIPRRPGPLYEEDIPVTPLTGRFDHTYFEDWERASQSAKSQLPISRSTRSTRYRPRMRSDTSPYCSPVASPIMSPRRSNSPQPSRSKAQTQPKSKPTQTFHLGSLPRFHPAVYGSNSQSAAQPPSPRQSRQPYRSAPGSRDMMWQYRELVEGTHAGPSAPRLDPLVSPGPVTPLALEAGDYLAHGSVSNVSDRTPRDVKQHSGPPPELVEKLKAYEEKARQLRKSTKGR